jgi:WD40 repeat protein
VRVWSADSGLELHSFFDCTANVTDLAFALDSRLLAASASDGSVHLWDAWSGTALQPLPDLGGACSAIAWSPGGRILATASDTQLLLWHREG